MNYDEFLANKLTSAPHVGFDADRNQFSPKLFPFQSDIVEWACKIGRSAIFSECGTGKTAMQVTWAQQVVNHTGGDVLILAPLAVASQTAEEGEFFGVDVTVCRTSEDVRPGVNVTNYDRLHLFDCSRFVGVVLDESSILKNFMGKIKQNLITQFENTSFKLCCTATPAPNDHMELGTHSDFLGIMPRMEMLARWFTHDSGDTSKYKIKAHGEQDFWRWVSTWAVSMTSPSDLGYSDDGFILPPLHFVPHVVTVDDRAAEGSGELFRQSSLSATNLHSEMRLTCDERAAKVAEIIGDSDEPWIIWCNTNYEADALKTIIPGVVEVRGSDSLDLKEKRLHDFAHGKIKRLLSKPSICAFGVNWQHCHNMAFVGLSYSYEQMYQALRRSWRFGQKHEVNAHVVHAHTEEGVMQTIQRKQKDHENMRERMTMAIRESKLVFERARLKAEVETEETCGADWRMILGDSCREVAKLPDNSIHFSVFSPPFSNLFIYSDALADMGNACDHDEFFSHFDYLVPELLRVTIPGRLCAVHCSDLPVFKWKNGYSGLYDLPGELIKSFERGGWSYHSRVTIWKDPVIEMQRTKANGLLYMQVSKDSTASRQGMADYMLIFRNCRNVDEYPEPVTRDGDRFAGEYIGDNPPTVFDNDRHKSIQVWQRYADPVWSDIRQGNVLNRTVGTEDKDEKHICPLQLDVIERCIELWTNPGDTVLSPFGGIGSEGYTAIKMGRKFVGIELKRAYYEWAVRHLQEASGTTLSLFDIMPTEEPVLA